MCQIIDRLLEAAGSKWPEVFPDSALTAIKDAISVESDTSKRILMARTLLLKGAEEACSRCQDCESGANRYCKSVFGDGIVSAPVVAVGEGPGQFEQRTLIPFTHVSEYASSRCFLGCKRHDECFPADDVAKGYPLPSIGCDYTPLDFSEMKERLQQRPPKPNSTASILNYAMRDLFTRECWNVRKGIAGEVKQKSDIYITNVVKCRCTDENGKDKTPTMEHVHPCEKWLEMQLTIIQPEVVILIGRIAAQRYLGSKFGITANNGRFDELKDPKSIGLPGSVRFIGTVMHPAGISRISNPDEQKSASDKMQSVFYKAWDNYLVDYPIGGQ